MQLDLSSGELRPESLPHHLPSLGTDPSMGNSRGLQPWKAVRNWVTAAKTPAHPKPCLSLWSETLFSWEMWERLSWRTTEPSWSPSLCFFKTESCPGFTEPWSVAHKPQAMWEVMWELSDLFTSSPPTINWNQCINRSIWRTDSGGSPRVGNQHSALLERSNTGLLGPAESLD